MLVSSLLTVVVATLTVVSVSVRTVVVASLAVIVIAVLAVIVVSSLPVVVATLLTRLSLAIVVAAVLTLLVSSLLMVVVSSLAVVSVSVLRTWLIGPGLVCGTLLFLADLGCMAFVVFEVGTLGPRLVGAWLICTGTLLVASVIVVVALLISVVIAALRTRLIGTFRAIFAVFVSFGALEARAFVGILSFRHAIGLPDAGAFGFLFVRIRFHNCLCLLYYLSAMIRRVDFFVKVLSLFVFYISIT